MAHFRKQIFCFCICKLMVVVCKCYYCNTCLDEKMFYFTASAKQYIYVVIALPNILIYLMYNCFVVVTIYRPFWQIQIVAFVYLFDTRDYVTDLALFWNKSIVHCKSRQPLFMLLKMSINFGTFLEIVDRPIFFSGSISV